MVGQGTKGNVQTLQNMPQTPACKTHKQPILLPGRHIIEDAGNCETMCLSINTHHWFEEVKLFS